MGETHRGVNLPFLMCDNLGCRCGGDWNIWINVELQSTLEEFV